MTISSSTTTITMNSAEEGLALETLSEGNDTAASEVTLLEGSEYPIIRALSDTCVALLSQTGNMLSQYSTSPKSPNSMKEQLLAKHELSMKSLSLPNLSSQQSSQLNSSSYKQTFFSPSPFLSGKQQKEKAPTSHQTFPYKLCPTPQEECAEQTLSIPLQIPQPEEENTTRAHAQMILKQIPVKTYSKSTIQKHSAKGKETQTSAKLESHQATSTKQLSSTLSPMSLYSHLQKELQETTTKTSRESEESKEDRGQQERSKDQEQQRHHHQDQEYAEIKKVSQTEHITNFEAPLEYALPEPLIEFALSEAQLSSIFRMRVSNLDVLRICIEIMKLMLNSREEESLARREERKQLLEKAQDLVNSYTRQMKTLQWLGVATAVLGIVGAASPLVGEIAGDKILGFIQNSTNFWKNVTSKTFFKTMGKIFTSLSQVTETASKCYELKESAVRTLSEHLKEIHRMENDDLTRAIEEIKDNWKSMDNFLLHILQTDHDVVRSLYQ